jgi:predicted MFS family arabinose efflux permease
MAMSPGVATRSPAAGHGASAGLSNALIILFACAVGISVANLYYIQPLLASIRHDFGISSATAALAVSFTQVGYAFGLVFVLPLGDLFERRRLVFVVALAVTASLCLAAFAPDYGVVLASMALIGITSVVAHLLIPYAATLAPEHERGKVVGKVMSGLIIGILLARTVSGLIAQAAGWRVVFGAAAAAMGLVAMALLARLPSHVPSAGLSYGRLLASYASIARSEPVVLRRGLYGICSMGCFTVLWTSIAFLLAGAPYHYGSSTIGLFGLVGAAGAVMANVAGRLADRGKADHLTVFSALCLVVSFVPIAYGRHHLWALIVGIIVLDIGAQGMQITNQSHIFKRSALLRNRMNALYMTMFFVGATASSLITGLVYEHQGWYGVCVLGAVIGALALAASLIGTWRPQPPATAGTIERV